MSDYLSGNITFSGIASGTDFDTLIKGLLDVEAIHKDRMETWKATWEAKIEALQGLNTKLLALNTTLQAMDTRNEFEVKTGTSSNTSVLTATATSEAQVGAHSITVNQLASNDVLVHNVGYAETDSSVNSTGSTQTFSYTYKGEVISLDVTDGATLANLRDAINNDGDNPGVRASIISDGSTYHLQLRGMDLGSDADLTMNDGSLNDFDPANWENTQENKSALFKIDGWPSGGTWISNSSNTITNAMEGVTINLKSSGAAPPTTVTLTIGVDNDSIKENIRTFVDQVNEVRQAVIDMTKVTEVTSTGSANSSLTGTYGKGSILTGNYGVESLIGQKLKNITADPGVGFEFYNESTGEGDYYNCLAQLGIMTDADESSPTRGLLTLDEDELDAALANNPDGVSALFADYYVGESRSSDISYDSHISTITEAGNYEVEYTCDGSGAITSAKINGHAASFNANGVITGASGYPEAGLAVNVINTAAGGHSGTVSLKLGKIGELSEALEDMTSTVDGPIHVLEENYGDIIDSIDKRIEREDDRLSKMEERLRAKFARLETLLGQYNNTSAELSNQLAQLSNS